MISRHDDQFCRKVVKIETILDYFWPLQSLRLPRLISHRGVCPETLTLEPEMTEARSMIISGPEMTSRFGL